jgi:hypothetical protein
MQHTVKLHSSNIKLNSIECVTSILCWGSALKLAEEFTTPTPLASKSVA